jgi:DNA-directed RNA polymerase specialized sigma24 family protein
LVRTAIDNVRSNSKNKPIVLHLEHHENSINDSTLNSILDTIHEEALIGMIQSLKDEERIVFTLFEIEGYSHKEIEGLTSIKQNTSKWLLSKARSNLINIYRIYNKLSDAKNVK